MSTYYPKPLPHGYGVAQLDPPDERIPWCNCGHSWEDHHAEELSATNPETLETELTGEYTDVCYGSKTCECTHFEESDGIDPRF